MNSIFRSKQLLLFFILVSSIAHIHGQQLWQPLGPDQKNEFGYGIGPGMQLLAHSDTLFALSNTHASGGALVFKKFDGTNWLMMSEPFPFTFVSVNNVNYYPSITLNKYHVPYIAYNENITGKATVKKFENGTWVLVGPQGFTASKAYQLSIATDTAGMPCIAFTDPNNAQQPIIMKFDGTQWDTLGNVNFTTYGAKSLDLKIGTDNMPYLAFKNYSGIASANVMKLSGSTWTYVGGNPNISALDVDLLSMYLDANNTPYICYKDLIYNNAATVLKFDGNQWVGVGSPGFSSPNINALSMTIDNSGTPYMWINDNTFIHKYLKFNNGNWSTIWQQYSVPVFYGSIAAINNDLYYFYSDDTFYKKPMVKKLSINSGNVTRVGIYGFTTRAYDDNCVTVDQNNTPYFFFRDSFYINILKYNNGSWSYLPGQNTIMGSSISIAKGKNDTVFVSYIDQNNNIVISTFDGNNLTGIIPPFNPSVTGNYSGCYLALDTFNTPYIAYTDPSFLNRLVVKKYDGGSWVSLGIVATSGAVTTPVSMVITHSGIPYIACNNVVEKFENGSWQQVGPNFNRTFNDHALCIDHNDTVYACTAKWNAYSSTNTAFDASTVFKLSGNSWIDIGGTWGIQARPTGNIPLYRRSIYIDSMDMLYVVTQYDSIVKIHKGKNSWSLINGPANDWTTDMKARSFSLTMGSSSIFATYSYGGFYCRSQGYTPHPPPVISSPTIHYCQGATAVPLTVGGIGTPFWSTSLNGPEASAAPTPSTSIPGTFKWYVSLHDGLWISDRDSITVIVHPLPTPSIATNNDTLATGNYVTYQWYLNGNIISGANGQTLIASQAGDYTVSVTDTNGCTGTSLPVQMIQSPPPIISAGTGDTIYYCQNDTAQALVVLGQNLLWYNSLTGIGDTTTPIPLTNTPGITIWYVSQNTTGIESDKVSVTVIVHNLPYPTITANGNLLETGVFSSYQWSLNSTEIPNATSQSYAATQDGDYTVTVTDTNGCMNTSPIFSYTSTNGITSIQTESIQVYPNPAGHTIHIQSSLPVRSTLTTMSGVTVYKNIPDKDVDISNLYNGLYLLKIKDQQGRLLKTEKITKMQE